MIEWYQLVDSVVMKLLVVGKYMCLLSVRICIDHFVYETQ